MRVAVLYNLDYEGPAAKAASYESDAEIQDIAARVAEVLRAAGHEPALMPLAEGAEGVAELARSGQVAAVFNLVESLGGDAGREPEVPECLERARIPYTGNGAGILRLANAKDQARRVLRAAGVPVPRGTTVNPGTSAAALRGLLDEAGLMFPMFVKPARTDASIGVDQASLVRDPDALVRKLAALEASVQGPYLIEAYLPGREVNVAIFPEPKRGHLVCTEIDFSAYGPDLAPIVTYDCKWRPGTPDYAARSVPSRGRLSDARISEAQAIARSAFLALGGRSYGRVDLRTGADDRFYVIDVNPNPDIHPEAGLAIAASSVGVGYEALVLQILAGAGLDKDDKDHGAQADHRGRS